VRSLTKTTQIGVHAFQLRNGCRHRVLSRIAAFVGLGGARHPLRLTDGVALAKTPVALDPRVSPRYVTGGGLDAAFEVSPEARRCRLCRQKAVGVGQFLAQRSTFPAGRLCRGTAGLPSLEVASTASQHLNKRGRSTGRSRHATVSSRNMSRVNFNVPSYANSSESRLLPTRRPALCRSLHKP
jgi:hypothetical protein